MKVQGLILVGGLGLGLVPGDTTQKKASLSVHLPGGSEEAQLLLLLNIFFPVGAREAVVAGLLRAFAVRLDAIS